MSLEINEREWKEFFIGEIADISSGKDISEVEKVKGNIPYVSATSLNNGVNDFLYNSNNSLEEKCISVNRTGSVGYSFYHSYHALFSNNCRKLKIEHKSKNTNIFISNQINAQREKYNYGYILGSERLRRQKIILPINDNKKLDWQYMEQYTKSIIDKKLKQYIKYAKLILDNLEHKEIQKLQEKEWKEFFLIDVFSNIQRGKRLTRANQTRGLSPYISSTASNNGIDNFISNENNVRIFSDCLTIANSGSVGASFYHSYEFVASDHVTHLKNEDMSKFVYLFISSLTTRLSGKYNFNREINDKRISREKILLPINEIKKPDYKYMEQYMKNLEHKKIKQYLDYLEVIK